MDLDETVAFVEARKTGKGDLVLLGGVPLASQANGVQVQGKCWRCGPEEHNGKAFTSKCQKCSQVGHFTKVYKKTVDKKTKEEQVTTNTVQIMHSTMGTADSA